MSKLYVDEIVSSDGGRLKFPSGTISNPSFQFVGDTDTGLFNPNPNELGLVTGGQERFRIESTGQIKAVYESTTGTDYNTTLHNGYLCRAWARVRGASSPAILASGNVSSLTDNGGSGDWNINFTTNMPDVDYAVNSDANGTSLGNAVTPFASTTVSTFRVLTYNSGGTQTDYDFYVAVFR